MGNRLVESRRKYRLATSGCGSQVFFRFRNVKIVENNIQITTQSENQRIRCYRTQKRDHVPENERGEVVAVASNVHKRANKTNENKRRTHRRYYDKPQKSSECRSDRSQNRNRNLGKTNGEEYHRETAMSRIDVRGKFSLR